MYTGEKSAENGKKARLKNIVDILPSTGGLISGYSFALFIDIDGNIFEEDGTQLN